MDSVGLIRNESKPESERRVASEFDLRRSFNVAWIGYGHLDFEPALSQFARASMNDASTKTAPHCQTQLKVKTMSPRETDLYSLGNWSRMIKEAYPSQTTIAPGKDWHNSRGDIYVHKGLEMHDGYAFMFQNTCSKR